MNGAALFRREQEAPAFAGIRGLLGEEMRPGYPVEYLYARLRGRRSLLIANWKSLVYAPELAEALASSPSPVVLQERTVEGLWRALFREYQWVFAQMDEGLRRAFSPFFFHAELRNIFVCLRSIAGEDRNKPGGLLGASLLSVRIKRALQEEDRLQAVRQLENILAAVSGRFRTISVVLSDKGPREMEQELTSRTIAAILDEPLQPVMRQFFTRLVDSRNILSLYASIRNGSADHSLFHGGGTIPVERLRELQEKDDLFAVLALVKQAAGIAISDPDPTRIETALYRGVTKFLKTEGRDPLGAALILDYLWRCSLEVTNLSLLLAGKDLEREIVMGELVQ